VTDTPRHRIRFEFRVWGSHGPASRLLAALADGQTNEQTEDCYLLVDDPAWNVKVRNGTLKIKRLVAELDGFEQWAWDRHGCDAMTPSPSEALGDAFTSLVPHAAHHRVFVTKKRRRLRLGDLRAETTDITVHETGTVMNTLAIEGTDLDGLRDLRQRLGLRARDNLAVHRALCADR
jgi:hypothetical protein